MGTGLSQVNFLWLGERFSRSPIALWYSLRSASSALGDRIPLPPFSHFKAVFVIFAACGFSRTHGNYDKLTRPKFTTHLYSAASCPFIYSFLTSCPTSTESLSPSPAQKKKEKKAVMISTWVSYALYGNFTDGEKISPVISSVPQHVRRAPSLFLKELITSFVHFWTRWRSAPTWFQCCSISSYR